MKMQLGTVATVLLLALVAHMGSAQTSDRGLSFSGETSWPRTGSTAGDVYLPEAFIKGKSGTLLTNRTMRAAKMFRAGSDSISFEGFTIGFRDNVTGWTFWGTRDWLGVVRICISPSTTVPAPGVSFNFRILLSPRSNLLIPTTSLISGNFLTTNCPVPQPREFFQDSILTTVLAQVRPDSLAIRFGFPPNSCFTVAT
jgi:hypothetical protein